MIGKLCREQRYATFCSPVLPSGHAFSARPRNLPRCLGRFSVGCVAVWNFTELLLFHKRPLVNFPRRDRSCGIQPFVLQLERIVIASNSLTRFP
jgi:hypothetical protein